MGGGHSSLCVGTPFNVRGNMVRWDLVVFWTCWHMVRWEWIHVSMGVGTWFNDSGYLHGSMLVGT